MSRRVVRIARHCLKCGKAFVTTERQGKLYCTAECREQAKKDRRNAIVPVHIKKCDVCGKTFETTRSRKMTCSKECSRIKHNRTCKRWRGQQREYKRQYKQFRREVGDLPAWRDVPASSVALNACELCGVKVGAGVMLHAGAPYDRLCRACAHEVVAMGSP